MPQPDRRPALTGDQPNAILDKAPARSHPLAESPTVTHSPGRRASGPKWEEANRRFTCWLPVTVVEQIRTAAQRNGESTSAFVTRALVEALASERTQGR